MRPKQKSEFSRVMGSSGVCIELSEEAKTLCEKNIASDLAAAGIESNPSHFTACRNSSKTALQEGLEKLQ